MTSFSFEDGSPIYLDSSKEISNIAFDGCNYYFTDPCKCAIIKTDKHFNFECCYETKRGYTSLTYDTCDKVFWAIGLNCNRKIFKLDCCFNEIDYITLDCDLACATITGISYNCCCNTLVISTGNMVISVNKSSNKCVKIYEDYNSIITSVLSLCPWYIITIIKDQKQYIVILDSNGVVLKVFHVHPSSSIIKGIVYNPCCRHCDCEALEILVLVKGCYPHIYRIPLSEFVECKPACCNNLVCSSCCKHPQPPSPPCPTPNPCNEVLESIALVEQALAHILNAEGEKLQKIIAESDDTELLLNTNKEVNKTVVNVTHLEQVLYAKIMALQNCCDCDSHCNHKLKDNRDNS